MQFQTWIDSTRYSSLSANAIVIPKLTTAQRNALIGVPDGAMLYNIDTEQSEILQNSIWQAISVQGSLIKVVTALSDLPDPVAGVIQLVDNVTYWFQALVNVGTNQIQFGVSNTIFGFDKSDSGIIYTGVADLFIATNKVVSVVNVFIATPNGGNFNITNTTAESIQIRECIHSGLRMGSISGGNIVAFNNNIVGNVGDFTFTGTINKLAISTNFFLGTTNLTRQIYFNTLTVGNIIISNNNINVDATKIGIEANAVTLTNGAQIAVNSFSGTGLYLRGINNDDAKWELESNGNAIVPTSAGYNPNNLEVFRDDFIIGSNETGEIGSLSWSFNNGQVFLLNGEAGHPGIFRRTGSTDNQVSPFYLGNAAGFLPFRIADFTSAIFLFRGTDLANQFTMQIGISTDFGTLTPTNGIYLRKTSAETNFFAVNRASSIETSIDTGVVYVANTWYKLEITNDKINNTSIFEINGVVVATIATNKPLGTQGVNIGGNVVRISAANRNLDFDFISFIIQTTSR